MPEQLSVAFQASGSDNVPLSLWTGKTAATISSFQSSDFSLALSIEANSSL
jgi:hypothetical protein